MSGFTRAPRLRLASALFSLPQWAIRGRCIFGALVLLLLLGQPLLAQGQHVVQRGDTLYALADRYDTTVEALRSENGLSGSLLRVGQRLELPGHAGFRFESVEAGETLAEVAARAGLSTEALRLANPQLTGPLTAGTTVRVPPGDGVSLQLGTDDSLLALAMMHGVSPSELLEVNDLDHLGEFEPGDWVYLPIAAAAGIAEARDVGTRSASAGNAGVGGAATGGAPAVQLSPQSPVPSAVPDWHARRQAELLSLAPALLEQFTPGSSVFVMPLSGRLSSTYGWRNISVGGNRFHGGIDLAVDLGTPVAAAMDGVVARAGWVGAYGYAVYLDHGDGLQTRYAHLSELLVGVGETVRQGDLIARAGSTGASTGPHLHFEIRVEGQAVDPLSLLE